MNELLNILGWIGLYSPVVLGGIGSGIGCTIAGQAAIGAMLETEGGWGRYIGLAILPSSNIIYGIVVMFALTRPITPGVAEGLFVLGLGAGIALLILGIYQGTLVASAIAGSKEKPAIFGLSIAPAAVVEGFCVFTFIFVLVLAGSLPSK
ncbi:MAG: ATP synthase subunit C [Verrucomicrobia bacterium]|nr:ATP synthase subunit C [Verrucomicrobiota bacterium]